MRFLDKDVHMKHDVFISYSTKNKDAAQAICHVLEQNELGAYTIEELKEKIFSGEIEDAKTVSSLMAYAVKYGK